MKKIVIICMVYFVFAATSTINAEPMRFYVARTGGNCSNCTWVQASGEITPESSNDFKKFISSLEYSPGLIRLNSPGGSLAGGISLGIAIRNAQFDTEVGNAYHPAEINDLELKDRSPGVCASACAYAFLGGISRYLDEDAKLGFHQFYDNKALEAPSAKLFSGKDLDDTQRIMAAVILYIIQMGVDPKVVIVAANASPNDMRWIDSELAQKLGVVYEINAYRPWHLEPYKGGAIAVAESNDGAKSIIAACSKKLGPYVTLISSKPTWDIASWFEQCKEGRYDGKDANVFGEIVPKDNISIIKRKDGAVMLRFQLPNNNPPFTSTEFLTMNAGYSRSCHTNEYTPSKIGLVETVRLAFRNCLQE